MITDDNERRGARGQGARPAWPPAAGSAPVEPDGPAASVPIVTGSDPARLLDKARSANRGRDVHLVGGPRTIETFRTLGALDRLGLLVLALLLGGGMRLTPWLSPDARLVLDEAHPLPRGTVEITYAFS